jgi:hypothetical protein
MAAKRLCGKHVHYVDRDGTRVHALAVHFHGLPSRKPLCNLTFALDGKLHERISVQHDAGGAPGTYHFQSEHAPHYRTEEEEDMEEEGSDAFEDGGDAEGE